MDLLGPDISSTSWMRAQVLHRERAHLKVPGWPYTLNLPNHSKQQKFFFQIGTLDPHGFKERFSFDYFIFVFSSPYSRQYVAPISAYKPTHNPQFLLSLW